jgi:hypothetical protein
MQTNEGWVLVVQNSASHTYQILDFPDTRAIAIQKSFRWFQALQSVLRGVSLASSLLALIP